MQTHIIDKEELNFIGLETRTNNTDEIDPTTAKIPQTWDKFFNENIISKIQNNANEKICYGVYSDFEDGAEGKYSLTVGAMVTSCKDVPEGLVVKTLPKSKYMVFTTDSGPMPKIIVDAWIYIWKYFQDNPEHERSYTGDFEVYDERTSDMHNAVIDIYISIK